MKSLPEVETLKSAAEHKVYNLIQLVYRAKQYEGDSKDYEFSFESMEDHWQAGYHHTVRTLRHREVLERPTNCAGRPRRAGRGRAPRRGPANSRSRS